MAASNSAYISALRSSFNRIIHLIDDCFRDAAALEYALFQVDVLYQAVQRFSDILPEGDAILDRVYNVCQILVAAIDVDEASDHEGYRTECQISVRRGRPRFKISKEQLDFFVESGFTVPHIACLLNVSSSTVERRMREFSISVRNKYSNVSDEGLDNIVLDVKRNFPNIGYKQMKGFLSQRGYTVQQDRLRESMRRVDPEGALLQGLEMRVINRRHYRVAGPQCLWHIDGNHKLIRLVLHRLLLNLN